MPNPRVIAASIAALCCTPAFSADAVFFGDSLSDSGFYAPALPPGTGRFTTNPGPVWSEVVADMLGTSATPANQGGLNFAAGGARVTGTPGVPPSPPTDVAPPLRAQVDAYLAGTGGRALGGATHFVWAGANDIFFIAGTAATDPDAATAYLRTTTAEQAAEVARLSAAGARQIVVLNLPDIGATPMGIAQGPAGSAGLTSLSSGYNTLLFLNLDAAGVRVLGLDAFNLLREVQADPARYGFANATTPACGATASLLCTSADLVAAGADESFVFADGVHPTTGGHRLLAQYVAGMLAAPAQIGQLPEAPVRNGIAQTRRLWRNAGQAHAGQVGETNGWIDVEGGGTELDDTDGTPWSISTGFDRRMSEKTVFGASLSVGRSDEDWDSGGHHEVREASLAAYGGYRAGALTVSAAASLAKLDFDVRRRMALGAARRTLRGSTEGFRVAGGAEVAYALQQGALQHGPVANLLLQRVEVEGFDERSTDGSISSNLSYGDQDRDSALFGVGWQASYGMGSWTPYGSVMLRHEAADTDRDVEVSNHLAADAVKLPAGRLPRTWTDLGVGVNGRLANGMRLAFDLHASVGRKDLSDTRLSATLRMPF